MTFWIVRGGRHGEREDYALENNVVAIGWSALGNLSVVNSRETLQEVMAGEYPDATVGTIRIWTGEVWAFKDRMKIGDWIAMPMKTRSAIAIGKIAGDYKYVEEATSVDSTHQRSV